MLGFVSLGPYSTREMAFLASEKILLKLLGLTVEAAENAGITIGGYLTPQGYDLPLSEKYRWPLFRVQKGDRVTEEFRTLRRAVEQHIVPVDTWLVVLRPGLGWMNKKRIQDFASQVPTFAENCAISIKMMSAMQHPLWNIKVVPMDYVRNGNVYKPNLQGHLVTTLRESFPEFWKILSQESSAPGRSQDIKPLYHDDGALFACKPNPILADDILEHPAVCVCPESALKDRPMHERMPVFDVNRDDLQDYRILEALLPEPASAGN